MAATVTDLLRAPQGTVSLSDLDPGHTSGFHGCTKQADKAPWYVAPSDHTWYRNRVVSHPVVEALRGMELERPEPDYDVDEQRARLEAAPS